MMKKRILCIATSLVMMTISVMAQSYTFQGQKYDWKLAYSQYCEGTNSIAVKMGKNPISSTLTVYVSKGKRVAIVTRDKTYKYPIDLDWFMSGVDESKGSLHVQARASDTQRISYYLSLSYNGDVYVSLDQGRFEKNLLIEAKNGNNATAIKEIASWLKGQQTASQPTASTTVASQSTTSKSVTSTSTTSTSTASSVATSQQPATPKVEVTNEAYNGNDGSRWTRQWHKFPDATRCGIVDAQGKEVVPAKYEVVKYKENSNGNTYFEAKTQEGYLAIYSCSGRCIISESRKYKFVEPRCMKKMLAWDVSPVASWVNGTGYHGLLDAQGRQVVAPQEKYDGFYLIPSFNSMTVNTDYLSFQAALTDDHDHHRLAMDLNGNVLCEGVKDFSADMNGGNLSVRHDGERSHYQQPKVTSSSFTYHASADLYNEK